MAVHHPWFARFYTAFAHVAERASLARLRARTLADARGRLLVVGAGQNHDLLHLPPAVTEVVAVEPDATMRRLGRHRLATIGVPAWAVGAVAERLPLADDSVDTVLCALVLCSVDDPDAAARASPGCCVRPAPSCCWSTSPHPTARGWPERRTAPTRRGDTSPAAAISTGGRATCSSRPASRPPASGTATWRRRSR